VDNLDGTVTDTLTGLQWEKKANSDNSQNLADPHDADNYYTWSVTGEAADGTVFTAFLATLNNTCFAGHCDWRLPTRAELLTIEDPALGPDLAQSWSSSSVDDWLPISVRWAVSFNVSSTYNNTLNSSNARAVR
jgi:hypothetical protein